MTSTPELPPQPISWAAPGHETEYYARWLFLHTYDDLRDRVKAEESDRYKILGISPLLRKLLIDGKSLAHVVRANAKESPLKFAYTPHVSRPLRPEARWVFASAWSDFFEPSVTTGLREFLAAPFGETRNSKTFTVKEYVLHYAHVEGGVHIGDPKDELSAFLVKVTPTEIEMGFGLLRGLASIGTVVLAALRPTYDRLTAQPPKV